MPHDQPYSWILDIGNVLLVALLVGNLRRRNLGEARVEGSWKVLECNKSLKRVVWLVWLWVGVLVYYTVAVCGWDNPTHKIEVAGIIGLYLALMLMAHLEIYGGRIYFNGTELQVASFWGARSVIPWAAVESVRLAWIQCAYVLKTREHGRVRLSFNLDGLPEFRAEMERHGIVVPLTEAEQRRKAEEQMYGKPTIN